VAKLLVNGVFVRAKAYRLTSSKPAYEYQHLYHHVSNTKEYMAWKGEYPDGNFTDLVTVPDSEYDHWKRRIKAGEAKPEAQLMSEYSRKIAGDVTAQIQYQLKITQAARWYKGQRV
jgi:hypothetical protein